MSAYLFIQNLRKNVEKIDFVSTMRLAMNGTKRQGEKQMERWAKSAELDLRFED